MPIFPCAWAVGVKARVAVATMTAGRRNLSIGVGILVCVWKKQTGG
jgi:hypothetical protein